jgi:hypothetical protein
MRPLGRPLRGHWPWEDSADLIVYARGTRYHIHRAGNGLLAAGEPGVQLTWTRTA